MKNRSIAAVILLPFVTLGLYTIYWFVSTKGELNTKGANIPTAWLLIIPFVNIWWMWKYFEAAEQITNKKVNGILMFVLAVFITSIISSALCQNEYNNLSESAVTPEQPLAPAESSSSETLTQSVSSIESASVAQDSQSSSPEQPEDTISNNNTPTQS